MGEIVLTEDCMRLMAQFEQLTGASSRDCIIDDRNSRIILVVNPGEMGRAIGKKGASIKNAMEVMGKRIEVVEYTSSPEQFIRNCFLPAQVTSLETAAPRVGIQLVKLTASIPGMASNSVLKLSA